MGTLKVLPESVPFSVDPDGTVRVKNSMVLDRETTANITFQVGYLCEKIDLLKEETITMNTRFHFTNPTF